VAERDVVDVDEHFVLALLAPDLVGADKGEGGPVLAGAAAQRRAAAAERLLHLSRDRELVAGRDQIGRVV
jgi:hypothetical protein